MLIVVNISTLAYIDYDTLPQNIPCIIHDLSYQYEIKLICQISVADSLY